MRSDLLQYRIIRRLAFSRTFRPALLILSMSLFAVLITAGLFGTPLGNRNASIVLVWMLWFAALMIILIPLGGRIWCLLCPIPSLSEWISRGAIISKKDKIRNLGYSWPGKLDNIWLQNIAFLGVAVFSPLILTRPKATAYALLIFVLLAIAVDLSFRKPRSGRMFCRYLCPIGGFLGLYSSIGPVEIRSRDKDTCKHCTLKTCIKGNERGYGCPWLVYPGGLSKNAYCGLCLECIKSCAYQNMTIKTRMPGKDLLNKPRLDEAFKGFIMLGSAWVYTAAYFGWWNNLKAVITFSDDIFLSAATRWDNVGLFASLLIGTTLLVLPVFHAGFTWMSKRLADSDTPLTRLFIDYAMLSVPLGFMAWVGFVVGMLMVNGSYILSSLSDPLGYGWDIFGTAGIRWSPFLTEWVPYIQLVSLLIGAFFAAKVVYSVSKSHFGNHPFRASIPMALWVSSLTMLLMMLSVMP